MCNFYQVKFGRSPCYTTLYWIMVNLGTKIFQSLIIKLLSISESFFFQRTHKTDDMKDANIHLVSSICKYFMWTLLRSSDDVFIIWAMLELKLIRHCVTFRYNGLRKIELFYVLEAVKELIVLQDLIFNTSFYIL